MKPMTFTAVFRPFPEGYAAWVEELPGANTQGATLEEARANLAEAVELVLEANRVLLTYEAEAEEVTTQSIVATQLGSVKVP